MLEPGDRVIAALSGGADSVCLLSILTRLRESLGIRLRAVHIHHGLRGGRGGPGMAGLPHRSAENFRCPFH